MKVVRLVLIMVVVLSAAMSVNAQKLLPKPKPAKSVKNPVVKKRGKRNKNKEKGADFLVCLLS